MPILYYFENFVNSVRKNKLYVDKFRKSDILSLTLTDWYVEIAQQNKSVG